MYLQRKLKRSQTEQNYWRIGRTQVYLTMDGNIKDYRKLWWRNYL